MQRGKGAIMNNILFFLTPKALCAYLYDDYTISKTKGSMNHYIKIPKENL